MQNDLEVGARRHGRLFDENPDSPDISATLERTDTGIYVSIHWDSEKSPELGRWFTNDGFYSGEPDQEKPAPKVPSDLIFQDSRGTVGLVGCRGAGYHTNFFIGTGRIRVGTAVIGASSTSYSKITGLRSEVSGLRAWLGKTSIKQTHTFAPDGPKKTTIEVTSQEPIGIPDTKIILRPIYLYSRNSQQGSVEVRDAVQIELRTEQESPWKAHIGAQRAIRDLLAISRWRDESLIPISVTRPDDAPQEDAEGAPSQREKWLTVFDDTSNKPKEENTRIAHFIEYGDLLPEGISRWMSLRNAFSRAIDPAVSSIYLEEAIIEVRLTQIAISLEALGYLIVIRDDGASEASARNLSFRERVERIAKDVDGVLPFIDDDWFNKVANSYNAVKHANRALPDVVDVANSWRECVLLFRVWVAKELGVAPSVLKTRASLDPMMSPYVLDS